VVDALELDRFVLLGVFNSGPAALTYAARHPERIAGLVLWCAYASGETTSAPASSVDTGLDRRLGAVFETGAHAFG
jgi:pimeloyl-ACP methyl ester carboxylesterase